MNDFLPIRMECLHSGNWPGQEDERERVMDQMGYQENPRRGDRFMRSLEYPKHPEVAQFRHFWQAWQRGSMTHVVEDACWKQPLLSTRNFGIKAPVVEAPADIGPVCWNVDNE